MRSAEPCDNIWTLSENQEDRERTTLTFVNIHTVRQVFFQMKSKQFWCQMMSPLVVEEKVLGQLIAYFDPRYHMAWQCYCLLPATYDLMGAHTIQQRTPTIFYVRHFQGPAVKAGQITVRRSAVGCRANVSTRRRAAQWATQRKVRLRGLLGPNASWSLMPLAWVGWPDFFHLPLQESSLPSWTLSSHSLWTQSLHSS